MRKTEVILAIILLAFLSLSACGGQADVGYTPPGIPVRISVNTNGEINLGLSGSYATPLGTFDLGYGDTIYSLREQYPARVLIVRVDGQAVVYQLRVGQEFHVEFDDNNKLYRRVALKYETDGDIVLELESVQAQAPVGNNGSQPDPVSVSPAGPNSPNTITSCPGAPPQQVKEGDKVYVCTAKDTVKLREKAGKQYTVLKYLVPGADLEVTGGPKCADNWSWWKVRTESGIIGWIAEGGDSVDPYFICPR